MRIRLIASHLAVSQVPLERREKIAAVAARRLSNVTCVLEGLYVVPLLNSILSVHCTQALQFARMQCISQP